MSTPGSTTRPQVRSPIAAAAYTEWLRGLDRSALAQLIALRPDLIAPIPADFSALAIRALAAPSIARAKDALNRNILDLLGASALMESGFTESELAKFCNLNDVNLTELLNLGLLIKIEGKIYLPDAVRASLGEFPLGLGPKSSINLDLSQLAQAPATALELAMKLSRHNPRGQSSDLRNPTPALKWLLDQNYLVAIDQDHVLLMREVAIALRGYTLPAPANLPTLQMVARKNKSINQAAIAAISNLLRWCEEIAHLWADESPQALKSGGLGLRDLRALASHLGILEEDAAFLAELMFIAKLVTIDTDDAILPTQNFDLWLGKSVDERWLHLIWPWLETSRFAGAIAEAKRSEAKAIAPLGPELDRPSLAYLKRALLNLIGEHPEQDLKNESIADYLRHYLPARATATTLAYLPWLRHEFELLGLTGEGAVTSFGAAIISGGEAKLASSLPAPIDHILLQSDLTAIAPGPLLHELADQLGSIADLESRGAASIYRFNESSIRRALDHGLTASEIRAFITKLSKTPVPQPLEYLIQDVAKRHGQLRIGSATTYLRCEDASVVQQILRDKELKNFEFRELAPQVIVSEQEPAELLAALRASGYLPMAESSAGVMLAAKLARRSKSRPQPLAGIKQNSLAQNGAAAEELISAAISALAAGERASGHAERALPKSSVGESTILLTQAVADRATVTIGYADTNGGVSIRVVDPKQVATGYLSAKDHATGRMEQFRISRITGIAPVGN